MQHGLFPDELVVAAGAVPLHLILGGKDEQELGDYYLSATTCPFGRSTLGFFEKKHPLYSLIDTMIVGTFCNGVQNVSNYLEYFNIPFIPFILPHSRTRSALNFYLHELKKIQTFLEEFTGNKITPQSLLNAIHTYNKMRNLLRKVNDYRKFENPPVRGMDIHQLVWQALLIGPQEMIPKIKHVLRQLENTTSNHSGVRLLLTGSGITLGDSILQLIEDQCAGLVVADDLWSCMDYFLEDVDSTASDLYRALGERYLYKNLCGRMIPDIRLQRILEFYDLFHASGVINHTLKYCDSYSNLKPEFRKILKLNNIPVLDLDRDYAESNIGQIKTRIEAFLEMIA
ncbi:MAG: 2-hydroxyacyl-CoA dehydratase family protein [Candidatus Helarchaeota archaeon]